MGSNREKKLEYVGEGKEKEGMRKSEIQRSFKGEEQHMSECTHTIIAYMFYLYILRYAICMYNPLISSQRTYIYINLIKKRKQVQIKKEIEKRLRSIFYTKDC